MTIPRIGKNGRCGIRAGCDSPETAMHDRASGRPDESGSGFMGDYRRGQKRERK